MSEFTTSHPTLLAVVRGIDVLALVVLFVALGILMLRLLPLFQSMACPMAPIGSPSPQPSPPDGLSCVADFTQTQTVPTGSERLSATIEPVVTNAIPLAAFLGAAVVRSAVGGLWPGLRQRAEQTETNP